ncbi:MAG: hypothetical protein K0S45_3376 [Nitrospira sp.]|jgi:hypothetical protein|nr:hypothetical protein [Nitrospira sp.]
MMKPTGLMTGLVMMILACTPLLYAIRTLIGMNRKEVYPLLRIRRTDGSCAPVMKIGTGHALWVTR